MPPREHRRKGSACPWLPLLAVAALAIAGVQVFMHHQAHLPASLDTHAFLSPSEVLCSTSSTLSSGTNDAEQRTELEAKNKALTLSLASAEAALRESQSRGDQLAQEAAALRQRAVGSTSSIPVHKAPAVAVQQLPEVVPPLLYMPPINAQAMINSSEVVDDSYALRSSDCSIILDQRTRIANMDEDFAFIKYDRGKVPFNTEWAACDLHQPAVQALHCLDTWLLTRCRNDLLSAAPQALSSGKLARQNRAAQSSVSRMARTSSSDGGSSFGGSCNNNPRNGFPGWLHEVASAYPALVGALDAPSSVYETQLPSRPSAHVKASSAEATSPVLVAPPRGDGGGLPVSRRTSSSSISSSSGRGIDSAQTSTLRYYYVAACLYNSATLLQNGWADQIVKLATHLRGRGQGERPDAAGNEDAGRESETLPWNRVFVSIYENDSKDSTPAELKKLKQRLDDLGVESAIVHERRGKENLEPDRIDRLVYARNKALVPLQAQAKTGDAHAHGRKWDSNSGASSWNFGNGKSSSSSEKSSRESTAAAEDTTTAEAAATGAAADGRWVIFLNDIAFNWEGVALMLETPVRYDMVCGMDTQHVAPPIGPLASSPNGRSASLDNTELYDVWVNRDLDGKPLTRKSPHYTHPLDQALYQRSLPVPVSCCWNGAVVVKMRAFIDDLPKSLVAADAHASSSSSSRETPKSTTTSTSQGGVVFRRPATEVGGGACDESECTTFCRDLYDRGLQRIYVNPKVWWGYSYGSQSSKSLKGGGSSTTNANNPYSWMTRGPRAQPPWGLTAPMPLPPVVSLVLAINRAERYPVAMGCCSLANGANFAPKLGLFVGCFHHSLSSIAQQHMQHAAAQLKNQLRAAVLAPPSPSLSTFSSAIASTIAVAESSATSSSSSRRQKNRRVGEAMQSASASGADPGLTAAVVAAAAEMGTDDSKQGTRDRGGSGGEGDDERGAAVGPFATSGGIWSSAADVVSEGALVFNRRAKCRAVFATQATLGSGGKSNGGYYPVQSSSVLKQGGVVDYASMGRTTPAPPGATTLDASDAVPIRRLLTREDVWMAPPIPSALPLFGGDGSGGSISSRISGSGSGSGVCSTERDTYRLAVGAAARPSYGPDMLLVSDKYQFVCIVIWKVASRTLLKQLEGSLADGGLGAKRTEGYALTPAQRRYTTFTFVREPLARYVSGYFSAMKWVKMKRHKPCAAALAKAYASAKKSPGAASASSSSRSRDSSDSSSSTLDDLNFLANGDIDQSAETEGYPGEPGRFVAFTRRFLGSGVGTGVAFPGVQHIFSQASFLSVTDSKGAPLFPRLDFIGTLERFGEDWANLEQLLRARPNVPLLPLKKKSSKTVHRNPTPSGFSAHLKSTLLNDTKLLKMVCDFYTQDYLCFGYKRPVGCEPPPPNALKK